MIDKLYCLRFLGNDLRIAVIAFPIAEGVFVSELDISFLAELMTEKRALEKELESYQGFGKTSEPESKLNEISHITEIIENQPLQFDDNLIRQMLECVVVQSKEQIKIVFKDGTEVDQPLS